MGEQEASTHSLSIANRERVQITGVLAVDSFDDEEVNLETEMGLLHDPGRGAADQAARPGEGPV